MKITVDGTIARLEVLPDSVAVGIETDPWALQQIHVGREHAASLCAYVGKPCTISIEVGEPADGLRPITIGESGGEIHVNSSRQSPVVSVSQGGVHISDLSGESAADRILAGSPRDGGSSPSGHCYGNPAMTPLVNPLDEGWRVLTAAMEKRGFVRMPFDGTRVVKFVERNASIATSLGRLVTVNDEYAARFSGASGADVDSLLSAMGIQ